MFARVLLFCYVKQYPSPGAGNILQPELEYLVKSGTEDVDEELTVHAAMYGMGEKYDIPDLKKLSLHNFAHTLKNTRYSATDFINSIHVAFTTTLDTDQGLRKYVVWEAQRSSTLLAHHPDFKSVLSTVPEFAYDVVTKYARGTFVWCTRCKKSNVTSLENHCTCGCNSICELSNVCKEPGLIVGEVGCKNCWSYNQLQVVGPAQLRNADANTFDAFRSR